jgi:hypothetical protein
VKKPKLIVSEVDYKRLQAVIGLARMDSRVRRDLQGELGRARVASVGRVPR